MTRIPPDSAAVERAIADLESQSWISGNLNGRRQSRDEVRKADEMVDAARGRLMSLFDAALATDLPSEASE